MTDPVPDAAYHVSITLRSPDGTASETWEVYSDDLVDPDAPTQVLDSLTLGWSVSASEPWPFHPPIVTCSLGLLAVDGRDLRDLTREGNLLILTLETDGPPISGVQLVSFVGRITYSEAVLTRRKAGDVSLYSVSASDLCVDLAETSLDFGIFPAQTFGARLDAINTVLTRNGHVGLVNLTGSSPAATLAPASPGVTDAYSLLTDTLRQRNGGGEDWKRYYVRPYWSGTAIQPYEIATYEVYSDPTNLPAEYAVTGGILDITIVSERPDLPFPPILSPNLFHAGVLRLDEVKWKSDKVSTPTVVTLTGPFGLGAQAATLVSDDSSPARNRIKLDLKTDWYDLGAAGEAAKMLQMYEPNLDAVNAWEGSEFVAHVSEGSNLARITDWFPVHTSTGVVADLDYPNHAVTLYEIPDSSNLGGAQGIYAGQLRSVTLTIANRRVDVRFSLRHTLPRSRTGNAMTASYDVVAAAFPTIDYDHVDPDLTYYNARLARKA